MKAKIYVIIGIVLMLIPLVMAFEFDNVKSYDPVTGIITITNAFGFGDDLFIGRLISPQHNYVIPGNNRLVAEVEVIYIKKQGTGIGQFFNGMQFQNIHANNNTFNRDYDWYSNITNVIPVKLANVTGCSGVLQTENCNVVEWTEYRYEKDWEKITGIGQIPDGNFSIGLHTNVPDDDYVEWIPNFFGVDITEWAFWQDGFGTGLISYYGMNGTAGAVRDNLGNHEGTINGAITRGHLGIDGLSRANNSVKGDDGTTDFISLANPSTAPCNDKTCTVQMWLNMTTDAIQWFHAEGADTSGNANYFAIGTNAAVAGSIFVDYKDATTNDRFETGGGYLSGDNLDNWQQVVFVANGTSSLIYVNGTFIDQDIILNTPVGAMADYWFFQLGALAEGSGYQGYMDEVGIWSRALSASEISDLYDNGLGMFYNQSVPAAISTSLNEPASGKTTLSNNFIFNANVTPISVILKNNTFFMWDAGGSIVNQTFNGTIIENNRSWFNITGIAVGAYTWNVMTCGNKTVDGTSVCAFDSTNRTFTRNQFTVDQEFYDLEVYETENVTFRMNITVDPGTTFFSASLVYNGTSFIADTTNEISTGSWQLIRGIDIPQVAVNNTKNYHWEVTLDTGSGFSTGSSTTKLHNISQTNVSTNDATPTVNFTIYDEETLNPVNASFDSTINWFLGSGTQLENTSYSLSANNSYLFYLMPSIKNFTVTSDIRLEDGILSTDASKTYHERSFDVDEARLGQSTIEQKLYLLASGNGTNVIIEVKDTGLGPLEDYLVTIERFYPGENVHRMVEQKKTDVFGQITARLIENTVKYKITFRDPENNIVKTVTNTLIACRSAICLAQFIIEDPADDFVRFDDLENHEFELTFDNNTNIFTVNWNDGRGESSLHRLKVDRRLFNGTTVVCNETSLSQVSSMTCSVGDQRASYTAQVYRKVGATEKRISVLNIKVGDIAEIFGKEGLMWSFFLLFTLIAVGSFHPPSGMALYLVGFFVLGVTGIVYINPALLIAQLIIGGAFIYFFKS